LVYANEFILIGDSYYHIELTEKIINNLQSVLKSKNILFLNKKNMSLFNKNFNITHSQFKILLSKLNYQRDENNPVKYILKNKKEDYKDSLFKDKKNMNSPFSILKNLKIN